VDFCLDPKLNFNVFFGGGYSLVPFDEDDKDDSVWFLDHDYLENMYGMFKKVNGKSCLSEKVLWQDMCVCVCVCVCVHVYMHVCAFTSLFNVKGPFT
jgi:hypothetical protein